MDIQIHFLTKGRSCVLRTHTVRTCASAGLCSVFAMPVPQPSQAVGNSSGTEDKGIVICQTCFMDRESAFACCFQNSAFEDLRNRPKWGVCAHDVSSASSPDHGFH